MSGREKRALVLERSQDEDDADAGPVMRDGGVKRARVESQRGEKTSTSVQDESKRKVIVILEQAALEIGKVGKDFQLLNCDDHQNFLKKHHHDPAEYRPDIAHQCLLTLLDSPLNKAGLLQVYVHTRANVLIQISPHLRIPRTFKRFSGLIVQLLHKMKIRSKGGSDTLLKVIRNPVESHLPVGCPKIGFSFGAARCVNVADYVVNLPSDQPWCFVIGAMSHGSIDVDFVEDTIAISQKGFPLIFVLGGLIRQDHEEEELPLM